MGRSRLRVVPLSAKITELINSTTGIYLQAPKPSLHPTQQRPGGVAPTDPQQVSLSFSKGGSPRERPGQWAVTWRALGIHRVLYTEDCCLPFQPIFQPRLSPSAPRFSGFPASCQPDAPPSGASSYSTTFHTSIFLLQLLPSSDLQQVSLDSPSLIFAFCSHTWAVLPRASELQGACLCPYNAEGSLPGLQCLVLPGTGALVQVLTNATLSTRGN